MNHYLNSSEPDTKMRIFLTAAELFAKEGYDRVPIRQICEKVGVGKPTLYYYFKDKETLLTELVQYSFTLAENFIKKYMESQDNYFDKLRGIIHARKAFMQKYPYFMRFFIMLHLQPIPKTVFNELGKIAHIHFNKLITFLKEGQQKGFIDRQMNILLLANTITGTLNQLFFRYALLKDKQAMSESNLNDLFEFWKNYLFENSNELR